MSSLLRGIEKNIMKKAGVPREKLSLRFPSSIPRDKVAPANAKAPDFLARKAREDKRRIDVV